MEIALGLLIVGLMMGVILKGQSLIEQARLHKTISQLAHYQSAFLSFKEIYGALPGDWGKASSILGDKAPDGNDNQRVDGLGLEGETLSFWKHLVMSGLIIGGWGPEGVPASPLGGWVTVEEDPDGLSGLWMMLGKRGQGKRNNFALLTPQQAAAVTRRLDDGLPFSGDVRSQDGADVPPGSCVKDNQFNVENPNPACVLYMALR